MYVDRWYVDHEHCFKVVSANGQLYIIQAKQLNWPVHRIANVQKEEERVCLFVHSHKAYHKVCDYLFQEKENRLTKFGELVLTPEEFIYLERGDIAVLTDFLAQQDKLIKEPFSLCFLEKQERK